MKGFEGICMMCRQPLLIHTVSIDGNVRPFCPKCQEFVLNKTKQSMEKRGRRIRGKDIVFPNVKE